MMDISQLKQTADSAYQKKNYLKAAALYQQAAQQYELQNLPVDAAEMVNNASVAYLQANQPKNAYEIIQNTDMLFAELGLPEKQGLTLGNQAAALEALGKTDEALEKYIAASEILKSTGLKDNRAYVLKRISAIQIKKGQQIEALGSMGAALDNAEKLSGREKLLKKLTDMVFNLIQRG
jgi:tetratricopeptide (TPR) repeat protein